MPSPINKPSTKYLFAATAVNVILEPVKPPVVALPAPASPFKFSSLFAAAGKKNAFATAVSSTPSVIQPINVSAVFAV